jgi:lipopolysaccharide/colanic/teichoic acid biosynthesis glycosyltransferase
MKNNHKVPQNKMSSFLIINPSELTKHRLKSIKQNFDITYLEKSSLENYTDLNNLYSYDKIIVETTDNLNVNFLHEIRSIKSQKNNIIDTTDFLAEVSKKLFITYYNEIWHTQANLEELKLNKKSESFKRIFDIIFVLILTPISVLLIFIAAILIKISSNGPIFFLQTRVGKNSRPFKIIKLRTMIQNNTESYTIENDERVFKVGKYLRALKIDELPQFYNILVGDMSLIGPRPERIEIVKKLCQDNPYYELRHLVNPGITGWAQVNDPTANPTKNFEKLEYDLYYIKNSSLSLDLKIIIKTIIIVFKRNSL